MNNYQITLTQKHNLEVALKNAHSQILHLETMLKLHTGFEENQVTSDLVLTMIDLNQSELNGLNEITQEVTLSESVLKDFWEDKESDVQN